MRQRYAAIWFRSLKTDWFTRKQLVQPNLPFVLVAPSHGRMIITALNKEARTLGVFEGMVLADARAIFPSLQVHDDRPGLAGRLLKGLGNWFIRYSPAVFYDQPEGLFMNITGCAHLWGGEINYRADIIQNIQKLGYTVRVGIADTPAAAWAVTRFEKNELIIPPSMQREILLPLSPAALRLDPDVILKLNKFGLRQIRDIIDLPRRALRRRFGTGIISRLDQALGDEQEFFEPVIEPAVYHERLPCIEAIVTREGIEIALEKVLSNLCARLAKEGKGLRSALLRCYRVDGKSIEIAIGTHQPSCHAGHLCKLFHLHIDRVDPGLGIEVFLLEAGKVQVIDSFQHQLWRQQEVLTDTELSLLLDRFQGKFGAGHIHRYLPQEHHWPEYSVKEAVSLTEKPVASWNVNRPRPLELLPVPEKVEVSAPIPDYPPMNFRYKGKLHRIVKADGPERIEQEWWLRQGEHRDYYNVEDETGQRYWLFRLGHYTVERPAQWFIHGYFS